MAQITLEFRNEHDLLRLLEMLRQFDVRIVQPVLKKSKTKHEEDAFRTSFHMASFDTSGRMDVRQFIDFLNNFNIQLPADYKFNREEANER